jgi:hypothetical protein
MRVRLVGTMLKVHLNYVGVENSMYILATHNLFFRASLFR